ncbi:hypothetical protein DPMN_072275 [Dreissena polymorpha]|uniref:Uncharacterized protein n=1 Tax=Dreissena polymorpha TaxID=45954 RepID=A0A9D3Z5X8_DREPO|nr:hypothetical protein DPMN_072275 [Dreissena polymorpha]
MSISVCSLVLSLIVSRRYVVGPSRRFLCSVTINFTWESTLSTAAVESIKVSYVDRSSLMFGDRSPNHSFLATSCCRMNFGDFVLARNFTFRSAHYASSSSSGSWKCLASWICPVPHAWGSDLVTHWLSPRQPWQLLVQNVPAVLEVAVGVGR